MTQEVSNEATKRAEPEVLVISAASVGKSRYIWLAATLTLWQEHKPEHHGYVETFFEALHECARAKDLLDPSRQLMCLVGRRNIGRMHIPARFARAWHQRLSEAKRKEKLSDKTDSARVEFVYSTGIDFETMTATSWAHLVLKKTAKRVVIQVEPYRGPHYVWSRVRTYHLDRAELEREGSVFHRWREFTLEPRTHDLAASHNQWIHEHAQLLGITWPCNRRELTKAFRAKVKEVHPDTGGTDAEFIKVRKAFEQLKAIAA